MPEIVITNIMDRLSIQDAVRTSILTTNWRFKWTLLSQLVFDEKFFKNLVGAGGTNNYDWRNVTGFLLLLRYAIKKFVLHLPDYMIFDVKDIDQWFLFLSRKGIKDVTVKNFHETPISLPPHLFSCLELNHLILRNCSFHPPPSFRGFPKLESLNLSRVICDSFKFGELITRCPLLEILRITDFTLSGKVELHEIVKLKNLCVLWLALRWFDITPFTTSTIFQFVSFLPKLQVLRLDFKMCEFLVETIARKGVRTSFPHLKLLELSSIDFGIDVMVSYVFEMICCSPNLQILDIVALSNSDVPPPAICSSALVCKALGKLKLRNVRFERLRGSENEVRLIECLLACSPLLKKMHIWLISSSINGGADGKLMLANKLLQFYRASPIAEIDISWF